MMTIRKTDGPDKASPALSSLIITDSDYELLSSPACLTYDAIDSSLRRTGVVLCLVRVEVFQLNVHLRA